MAKLKSATAPTCHAKVFVTNIMSLILSGLRGFIPSNGG